MSLPVIEPLSEGEFEGDSLSHGKGYVNEGVIGPLLDFEIGTLKCIRLRSFIGCFHFDGVNTRRHAYQRELTTVGYLPKRRDARRAYLTGRR